MACRRPERARALAVAPLLSQVLNQMHGFLNALIFTLTNHAFVRAMVLEGLRRCRCIREDEDVLTIGPPDGMPEPS